MALVKKYKNGNVLTYENVGTYNAEDLASAFTKSLDSYAKKFGLSGRDKQQFMDLGSTFASSIKNGNVTKLANGQFSIKDTDILNNTFDDKQLEEVKKEQNLGRGADKYEGEYQRSYGIFTSDNTENFRHKNHILGLLGNALNLEIAKLPTVESSKKDEKKDFNFDTVFNDANFRGNASNLTSWADINDTNVKRALGLKNAFKAIKVEDLAKEGEDTTQLLETLNQILNDLDNNMFDNARSKALSLGIDISKYFILEKDPANENPTLEELLLQEKEAFIQNLINTGYSREQAESAYNLLQLLNRVNIARSILKTNDDMQEAVEELYKKLMEDTWKEEHKDYANEIIRNRTDFDWNEKRGYSKDEYTSPKGKYYKYTLENPEEFLKLKLESLEKIYKNLNKFVNHDIGALDDNSLKAFFENLDLLFDSFGDDETVKETFPIVNGYRLLLPFKHNNYIYALDSGNNLTKIHVSQFKDLKGVGEEYYNNWKNTFKETWKNPTASNKKGGILKLQGGNLLENAAKKHIESLQKEYDAKQLEKVEEKQKNESEKLQARGYSKEVAEKRLNPDTLMDWSEFSWRVGALVGDLTSLIASMTSSLFGGSLVSGALGIGSTTANMMADVESGMSISDALVNNLGSYGLDLLSLFPYAKVAKVPKMIKAAQLLIPTAATLYGGYNYISETIPETYKSIQKVTTGEDLTLLDWSNIMNLFQGVLGTGAGIARNRKTLKNVKISTDVKNRDVKDSKGKYHAIPNNAVTEMKNATTYDIANDIFHKHVSEADLPKKLFNKEKASITDYDAIYRKPVYYKEIGVEETRQGNPIKVNPFNVTSHIRDISLPDLFRSRIETVYGETAPTPPRQPRKPRKSKLSALLNNLPALKRGGLIPKGWLGLDTKFYKDKETTNNTQKAYRNSDLFWKFGDSKYDGSNYIFDLDKIHEENDKAWKDDKWEAINVLYKDKTESTMFDKYGSGAKEWNELFNATGFNAAFEYDPEASDYFGLKTNARRAYMLYLADKFNDENNLYHGRYYDAATRQWVAPEKTSYVGEDEVVYDENGERLTGDPSGVSTEDGLSKKGPKKSVVTVGNPGLKEQPLKSSLNTVPFSEWARVGRLNRGNDRATEIAMDYDVAHKDFLHLLELLKGNYGALVSAQNQVSQANSLADNLQISDLSTLLGYKANTTFNNLQIKLNGDLANAEAFRLSENRINDMNNKLAQYNIGVGDYNRALDAAKSKSDATLKANNELTKYSNIDKLWMTDNYNLAQRDKDLEQISISQNMRSSALLKRAAQLAYETNVKKDPANAEKYLLDLMDRLSEIDMWEAKNSLSIAGSGPYITRSYNTNVVPEAKSGVKLTGEYILSRSKDYNKAKLEAARDLIKSKKRK